jgi:3-hydroxyacyl-CoA dehydrogenase
VPSAKVGLPEIKLGLMPGGGGTQRLPRLIGIEPAFDLISTGRMLPAGEALGLGVIDAIVAEGALRADAIAFAETIATRPFASIDDDGKAPESAGDKAELFARLRAERPRIGSRKAQAAIVDALEAAVSRPFRDGLALERELFAQLRDSGESKALRHAFFAEREAARIPDVPTSAAVRPVERIGVVGAGTMGSGITTAFLNAGIPVVLAEQDEAALERGITAIHRTYESAVRKGRITDSVRDARMALVTPALGLEALHDVDLVIEAVFEDMAVKRDIFARLDAITKPSAILASNTSFLDLDEIAGVTGRPDHVVGLHFFSPAHIMRLIEVVRGRETAQDVLATALDLAKRIGKAPVVSRVCHGFIANRVMSPRGRQANALILQGQAPAEIDAVMTDYGFAMGHFQMIDLAGLDVLGRGQEQRTLYGDFVAKGRLGQKSGGGFYDYGENRSSHPSAAAGEIIADFARFSGIEPGAPLGSDEVLFRLLLPVVNEGARLLEEGIAMRASDIDVAAMLGYGWPAETGGPMFWAEAVGLPEVVDRLRRYSVEPGDAFAPSPLLVRMAREGASFAGKDAD